MPIDLILEAMEPNTPDMGPSLPLRVGRIVEWAAIRIVSAFIIGMFVTIGMALAG